MAKDFYHEHVKEALEKSGWTITDDPLKLGKGLANYEIDLGAQQVFAANRGPEKIAVEVKSFISHSNISELQRALGQFLAYKIALRNLDPERDLFLAVPEEIFNVFFREDLVDQTLELASAKIVVYDPLEEKIVTWKNY
ncbi:MAG: element excision factor XisH family protein [Bacteroidota bacterium]